MLKHFLVQHGSTGISVGSQYYDAKKRWEETPLKCPYRFIVAAKKAKTRIRDGPSDVHCKHVENYIGTLDDRDLAKQLNLLRLRDADRMEEKLRD